MGHSFRRIDVDILSVSNCDVCFWCDFRVRWNFLHAHQLFLNTVYYILLLVLCIIEVTYHIKTEYFEWEVHVVGFERLFVLENNLLASCWAPLVFLEAVCGFVMNQPPRSYSTYFSWLCSITFFLTWAVCILLVGLTLDSGTEHFWTSSIFLTWETVCLFLCKDGSEHYLLITCCF